MSGSTESDVVEAEQQKTDWPKPKNIGKSEDLDVRIIRCICDIKLATFRN